LELQDDAGSGQVMHPQIHAPLQQLLDEMTEADTRKRPKSADQVWLRLKRIKQGKWGWIWSFLQGLLLGATPALLFLMGVAIGGLQNSEGIFFIIALMTSLCLLPIGGLILFIIAVSMLFSPRRRLFGLGMLTAMVLFLIAISYHWI